MPRRSRRARARTNSFGDMPIDDDLAGGLSMLPVLDDDAMAEFSAMVESGELLAGADREALSGLTSSSASSKASSKKGKAAARSSKSKSAHNSMVHQVSPTMGDDAMQVHSKFPPRRVFLRRVSCAYSPFAFALR